MARSGRKRSRKRSRVEAIPMPTAEEILGTLATERVVALDDRAFRKFVAELERERERAAAHEEHVRWLASLRERSSRTRTALGAFGPPPLPRRDTSGTKFGL